jgi:hypothetical protein
MQEAGSMKRLLQLGVAGMLLAALAAHAQAPAAPAAVVSAGCPERVMVRNAAGEETLFDLRQFVVDAGGIAKARKQVTLRILDARSKAQDDARPEAERASARAFASSLKALHRQLAQCG